MSVIIPAYNEEKSISEVVRGIRGVFERQEFPFEIIVVNDGSRDRTKEEALSAGATVISRPTNLGYGNALKLGVLRSKYDHVAICDADTTYEPEDFTRLIPFAESFDMVVGAREGREFLGHGWKRIGRWFQLQLVRLTIGRYIPDANSGMRIFQKSILLRYLPGLCGGFSFTTSISLVLHSTERAVKYLPIHYYSRTGTSHVHFVHDTLRSMQLLLQAILKYNPIKAFLFLSSLPAAMALVSLGGSIPRKPLRSAVKR